MASLPQITSYLGGLAQNAGNDVVGLGKGAVELAQDVMKQGAQGKTRGEIALNMGGKLVKGTIDEYGNLVGIKSNDGQPLLDPNKSVFSPGGVNTSGVTFNPNNAMQHAYDHPVNTALDVLPAIGAVKALKGAVPAAEGAEGANLVSDLTKPKESAAASAPKNVRAMEAPPVSDVAANTFLKAYTVPTGLKIDPIATAKWMINDKPDLSKLDAFMGSIENIKRDVLGKASDAGLQVNLNEAVANGTDALDRIPQLKDTPGKMEGYKQELRAMMPQTSTRPQQFLNPDKGVVNTTEQIAGANPLDTYDAIHNIEEQGYAYKNAAVDSYGTVKNVELGKVAKAYIDTASELEKELDRSLGKTGTLEQYTKSPTLTQAIKLFSPKVAERFQNNVHNWSDLRALQKPYVDMGKIIKHTNNAGHTAFANLSGGATRAMSAGAGTAIGGILGGPAGAVTGGIVGSLAEPFVAAGANKFLPPITSGIANSVSNISSGAGMVGAGAQAITRAAPAIVGATSTPGGIDNVAETDSGQPNNNIKHAETISNNNTSVNTFSKIPETVDEVQPDKSGNYQVLNPYTFKGQDGAALAVSDSDYQTQKAQFNKQKQSPQYVQDPNYRNTIDQGEAALDTKYQVGQKLGAGYQVANSLNAKMVDARKILNDPGTPSTILKQFGGFDALSKAFDGKYRQLAQDLKYVEDNYSGTGSLLIPQTKDVANQALAKVNQTMLNDYYSRVLQFTGGNSQPEQGNTSGTSQLPPITSQTQNIQPGGLLRAPVVKSLQL